MIRDFLNYIRENKLASRKDRILLAVSGGIDSMAMAGLFIEAGFKTGIAHCNFGLRGRESDLDEDLVRKFASDNNLEFYSVRFDTGEYASGRKISIQMAARELRYEWFEKIRIEKGYNVTAVAHNMNDNIETILINLVRGTGITGLTGISPSGNGIIRPLLFANRARIGEYCSERGIIYREDKSNAETKYIRNKIRHLVVPVLKEINPSIEETISATSKRLRGTLGIVTEYIESIREIVSRVKGQDIVFDLNKLASVTLNESVVYELFRPFGINSTECTDLLQVIKGRSGGMILTGSHRIIKDRDELIVTAREIKGPGEFLVDSIDRFSELPFIKSAEIIDYYPGFRFPDNKLLAFIDLDKVTFPLIIRKWEKGDSFIPLGMKGKKKLSDFFIDNKLSLPEKEKALVMESEGEIVWIIGERTDDRFKVTEATSHILRLELNSPD